MGRLMLGEPLMRAVQKLQICPLSFPRSPPRRSRARFPREVCWCQIR